MLLTAFRAVLMPVLFAASSCTLYVWQDDRSAVRSRVGGDPEVGAFFLSSDPGILVLHLSPEAAARLASFAPELPADIEWIEVCPRIGDKEVQGRLWTRGKERRPVYVEFFRDPDLTQGFWTFDPVTLPDKLLRTDYSRRYHDAACDVTVLPGPPTELGLPIYNVVLGYATLADDGKSIGSRIALTPPALVMDAGVGVCFGIAAAAMIPLLPFAWVAHELFGGESKSDAGSDTAAAAPDKAH